MRRSLGAIGHLILAGPSAAVAAILLAAAAVSAALVPAGVGIALLPAVLLAIRALARAQRARVGTLLGRDLAEHYRDPAGTAWQQLRTLLRDPCANRDLLWLGAHACAGTALAFATALWLAIAAVTVPAALVWQALPPGERLQVVVPVDDWPTAFAVSAGGLVLGYLLLRAAPAMVRGQVRAYGWLLSAPASQRLALRVEELSATRAAALDAHAAELRRIERDLHDGMQSHLVSIALALAVAQRQRESDPVLSERLIEQSRAGVEGAIEELQQVVRTIFPPILAERGLDGAVHALVAACPVRVSVHMGATPRLPAAVEAAAYFIVAEALANIAKHSGAADARLEVAVAAGRLSVRVSDDGRGGADERTGSGLPGIRGRVAALDGAMRLVSPNGGPTVLEVELPCG
jgi:signal transduction histidine kinase